jgi:hypothetical protein
MTHLLILLFYLFHYGRTHHRFQIRGAIPLLVRSPYLNCWGYLLEDTDTAINISVTTQCNSLTGVRVLFKMYVISTLGITTKLTAL